MKKVLKCGIFGYGYMGEIRKRVIEAHDQLELVGVCEPNADKRARLTCPTFETYQDLVGQNIDIAFVCTPNSFSPQICMDAMERGIHVFCEKPPGRNVQDIKNIRQYEENGVKLMFGFNHRYHPGILKAKSLIESGRFGRILAARGLYGKSGGANFRQSWRNKKDVSGGGILLDQGIHMLDLFRLFCDDFDDVKCFATNSYWKIDDLEDNAFVILRNKQEQYATLHSSATLWKHTFKIDLICEEGYMTVEGLLSKTGSYGRERLICAQRQFENETDAVGNPAEQITYFDQDQSWELEVNEFIRCIQENDTVKMSSSHDALRVMEIIEQAYKDASVLKTQEASS